MYVYVGKYKYLSYPPLSFYVFLPVLYVTQGGAENGQNRDNIP